MKVELGTDTFDSEEKKLLEKYHKKPEDLINYALINGVRKRDIVAFILEKGTYLKEEPIIDNETMKAIDALCKNGIIPVAVAEAIMSRIDEIEIKETSSTNSKDENIK